MTLHALVQAMMQTSILLAVMAIGLRARRGDVRDLLADRERLVLSAASMYLVMPILAIALVLTFNLPLPVEVSLLALAVAPIPPVLPMKGEKLGGRGSYATALLVGSAVVAVVAIPVAVALMGAFSPDPRRIAPNTVARLVASTVLIPLAAGAVIAHLRPGFARRAARPFQKLAKGLFLVAAVVAFAVAMPMIVSLVGDGTLLAVTLFVAIGLGAGHLLGGPGREDRVVLALSTASRHPGVAMAAGAVLAPEDRRLLGTIALYLLVVAAVTGIYSRLPRTADDPAPGPAAGRPGGTGYRHPGPAKP